MNKHCIFSFIAVFLILHSCKKGELPITPHNPGAVTTHTVDMDANYKWQIYFDLSTNRVVGQNIKTSWDLGFESSENGFHILLNTAKAMYAQNKFTTDFASVTDTIGFSLNKKWDVPSGNPDSTAIGDWRSTNHVYIIDRGYSETGIHQGFKKIVFQHVSTHDYTIRFSNLNGTDDITITIEKDSTYNMQYLSLNESGNIVQVEPPKKNWDICFTQYLHVFHEPLEPYLVTGCLLNRYKTKAILKAGYQFDQIDYEVAITSILSNHLNSIGYAWKSFVSGAYIVDASMNYILLDQEGHYYKLHFIDFYNASGVKGNPKWEFQLL